MEFLIAFFDWLKEHQVFEIASVLLFFKLLPWINYCFMEMKLPKFCLNISIISKLELRITQPSKKHNFFLSFKSASKIFLSWFLLDADHKNILSKCEEPFAPQIRNPGSKCAWPVWQIVSYWPLYSIKGAATVALQVLLSHQSRGKGILCHS